MAVAVQQHRSGEAKGDILPNAIAYSLKCVGKASVTLKKEQAEALESMFNGQDTFVWLPTGFGKSVCYECLPFLFDYKLRRNNSTVIVISPLISLMTDQVLSLRKRGVSAAILSSSYGHIDRSLLASELDLTKYSLLFAAPEAIIGMPKWRELLLSSLYDQIVAVAVDEAHCVSKW